MLTSPRTNGAENFVPSHHIQLITQPVLGARSRLRKKTTNIIVQTSTSSKEKLDSMTSSRRSSYNDSPPLILPINRVDTLQYQKKNNNLSYPESSDSGLDLSLSTNSSVQFQQHSQQHIPIHRPLSALNEDSSLDDGYHEEHSRTLIDINRPRCPPGSFGRNRSMEDMLNTNAYEEPQHRSSSFSDERQQRQTKQHEKKMKRSSEGALLDLPDLSTETMDSYRRTNATKHDSHISNIQQHRSLNDLTNKSSSRAIRHELNIPSVVNNLSNPQTVIRKPNTLTVKPLRKKTKLNIAGEPLMPMVSSRLTVYDEQVNPVTGTASSSSNQTTPRSVRRLEQQQTQQGKSKAITQLGQYPNQEQVRAHVNRSVMERQHPVGVVACTRGGVIQQIIPFDASPSKVNNLLLRHQAQRLQLQQQSQTNHYPSSNAQQLTSRHTKQILPTLNSDETVGSLHEEKRKYREQIKFKKPREFEEQKRFKQKEEYENSRANEIYFKQQRGTKNVPLKNNSKNDISHDHHVEQVGGQRHFLGPIQRQQEKELSFEKYQKHKFQKHRTLDEYQHVSDRQLDEQMLTSTPRRHPEYPSDNRQRRLLYNDLNRNALVDRYEFTQTNVTTTKFNDTNNTTHRRQQRPIGYSDELKYIQQQNCNHRLKQNELTARNRIHENTNAKYHSQLDESHTMLVPDYIHGMTKNLNVTGQSRPAKPSHQTLEHSSNRNGLVEMQAAQNRQVNSWQHSKHVNDNNQLQKLQNGAKLKTTRMPLINSKLVDNHDSRQEREASLLSDVSKRDSRQSHESKLHQMSTEKDSKINFQSKSPASWSSLSGNQVHQQPNSYERITNYQSESSTSTSSPIDETENHSSSPQRTYRILNNNQQSRQQTNDGAQVTPSNDFHVASVVIASHPSSCHTYPFTCAYDVDNNHEMSTNNRTQMKQIEKETTHPVDVYVLSDHDDADDDKLDSRRSLSPVVRFSLEKKVYSAQVQEITSARAEENESNYDSDDGWSDDSAELIYVDERYAAETRKRTSS